MLLQLFGSIKANINRIVLIFLLIFNIIPFAFGVLSSKQTFDLTLLIGSVLAIVLVQQQGTNQAGFAGGSKLEILTVKSLYAVWRIIESVDNQFANIPYISLKCQNGTLFDNKIFNGCLEVQFIYCVMRFLFQILSIKFKFVEQHILQIVIIYTSTKPNFPCDTLQLLW